MEYARRLYGSAYSTLVTLLGPLAGSIDGALESMGLERAPLALGPPRQLETRVAAYASNGNGHYQKALPTPNPTASKWGTGFYPMVDAAKPRSHNFYNPRRIKTRIAKEIYRARSAKKPKPTVPIKKVKRGKATPHPLRTSRHSRLFRSN